MCATRVMIRASLAAVAGVFLCLSASAQVAVPNRPSKPLFQGRQGEQRSSEVNFDPTTRTVTMKLSVQDLNGYFVPNLRRNNFAVFEDGVQQRNVTVEVEHAPITLAVLIEMGGRSQQLNKALATEGAYLVRPLLDVLGREDKLGLFTYDDSLHTIVDFDDTHDKWDGALDSFNTPHFSETNFYDAAVQVLDRLRTIPGRKALVLLTTGIDTFSHRTFDDVIRSAETANTPVYCLGLGDMARQSVIDITRGPLARVNWIEVTQQLQTLARVSGGRAYVHSSVVDAPTIYDDVMEHLRVRYVIAYVSSNSPTTGARMVQVRLVDPATGEPLRIVDANGRRVVARVLAQASYTPTAVTTPTTG